MPSHFLPRIASRIKFLVGTIIQREVSDPRLGLVTVIKVEPTADMKEAKVYISIFGKPGDRSRTLHALEDARGFIQRQVARNLETRQTPRLSFIFDESQDKVSRIEALVEQAKEDREDVMAKKPGKKDDKASKGMAPKAAKPPKPAKATKGDGVPARSGRPAAKTGTPKAEEKDLKARPGKKGPRGFGRSSDDELEGGREKEFAEDDLPEEEEEKEFLDEFDADSDEDEEDVEDEEEEAEEEEEREDDEDY